MKRVLLPLFCACAATLSAATFELATGEVAIKLESAPDKITPAADLLLTITIEAPSTIKVVLPDLRERFAGFAVADDFLADPVDVNGRTKQVNRWRLTPRPAAKEYRLAPFAVETLDTRTTPPQRRAFITKPVVFADEGTRPNVTGDPEVSIAPIWVPPTARTVALWIVLALFAIGALIGIIYGLMHLTRRVKEFRLSPMERALVELQRLLNRNLPQRGLYKDFYIELTMVVRRYIERTHGIRAPEQTTQEFLAAASSHPRFTADVMSTLKAFLESADLVKFAGQEATPELAEDATQKAKRYIENDAHATQSGNGHV